ncbi:tail fiber domain-containing protein [Enterococcus cecorum]|nr:tail fiber domain-containing protein [Enterococcus cecorum]MDZ5594456.1 tail fiber domain-containing protein [Enterococcus cecorum]
MKQEMSEKYAVKSDLTTLQGEYNSFKEETAKKISQQVSSIETVQTNTTEAQKLAGEAYNKAQSAATSATNASSTANSALDKASNATNVANSASQNATNAVASANSAVSEANAAKNNADKAIADVAALTKTVSSQSTRIDQTSNRIEQVASGVTEIGGKLDNLSIGGRNLLHGTVDFIDVGSRYNSGRLIETAFPLTGEKYKGLAIRGKANISGTYIASSYSFSNFNLGDTYTFSFYAKGSIDRFRCYFYGDTGYVTTTAIDTNIGWMPGIYNDGMVMYRVGSGSSKELLDSNIFKRYYVTWKLNNTGDTSVIKKILIRTDEATSGSLYICGEKMEIGNKNTDHSSSPEDDQSQIDGINSNIANNYYAKTAVDSKLSTAVSGITAQYTQDINTKLGNYYDKSTIDSKLTIDGQGIATYVKSTKSKLDNLSIGSDNLIINGGNIMDISPWQPRYKDKFGIYKHPFYYNGEKNIFRLDTTSTTDENYVNSNRFEVKRNTDYTLSLIGFYNGNIRSAEVVFLGRKSTETNVPYSYVKAIPLVLSNGSAVYKTITFNSGDNDTGYIRIDNNGTLSDGNLSTLYFCEVMLVEGTVAKKHQPSSSEFPTLTQYTEVKQQADQLSATVYDSASGLVTKTTQLANSYAIKQLNSAGDILTSLNLNANTSTAEIDAKLIRLNGYTKMDDAFINNLVANSILTNKIKSTEISGDIIKGGTIQGVTLKSTGSGAEPGEVEVNDGTIAMEKQEVGPSGRYFNRGFVSPLEMTMSKVGPVGGRIGLIRATSFTPFGFNNQALDTGNNVQNHRLFFHYQGLSIESDGANSGVGRNSGLKVFGDNAYIDLKSGILNDPGNDSDPIKMRIIATPNNTFEFRNNYGNIYMFTKNNENIVVNGYKIPYTWAESTAGIKYMRVIRPNESNPYIEISNHAGKLWGVSMWLSDQRLKSNIQSPTQDALATINQLKVRQFDWKSDNVHEDFGLVAQEVEEILPNAVFKVGGYYQIKDSGLIPVLIGAVQKLSNKVNLLENIIYNTKGSNLL